MEALSITLADSRNPYLDTVLMPPGSTITDFIDSRALDADGINLTVNGEQVPRTYAMQDGDVVTVTPRKVSGA